jgi:ectoine hydroxylase-related dioxygenase (phytanoyl-CoA dioxygenase family)
MTTDLSTRHDLVSDFLALPETAQQWQQYRLSDEQVKFYRDHGYLSGVRILTDEQVDRLRDELQEFFQPEHAGCEWWYEYHTNESASPDTVLFHALGAWRLRPGFHDVLWHPAFTVAASQLLDGPVRFWHDQLFCKPAQHGGVVAWHQDYSYWTRTKPLAHLTCWIGLDDSTRENGCLHYVPGSHQWDLLPITGLAGDMEAICEVLSEEQWEAFQQPVAVELKKGECSFHHGLTIHGSFENTSDRPRRAVVLNAFRDGTRSASDDTLLAGVPAIPAGQPMSGQFFPLLLDPQRVGL